ncbi:ribonuclease Y, partial [Streptococcus pyogenes]
MDMTFGIIAIVSALIGLVVGYLAISLKMKSAKDTAELTLINAEQEASNVRGKAEQEAESI